MVVQFWSTIIVYDFYQSVIASYLRRKKDQEDDADIGLPEVLRIVATGGTVLQLPAYITKTELHELIEEYWDELSAVLNAATPFNEKNYSQELLDKIQSAPTEAEVRRLQIIMYYTEEGLNDTQIWWKLEEAGVPIPEEQIRVYRSRIRKKYKISRSNKLSK